FFAPSLNSIIYQALPPLCSGSQATPRHPLPFHPRSALERPGYPEAPSFFIATPWAAGFIPYHGGPQLRLSRLGVAIDFAWRGLYAVHDQLEVVHQVFDVGVDPMLWGQRYTAVVDLVRPRRQVLDRLLDDAQALLHFLHPYEVPVIHVAAVAD